MLGGRFSQRQQGQEEEEEQPQQIAAPLLPDDLSSRDLPQLSDRVAFSLNVIRLPRELESYPLHISHWSNSQRHQIARVLHSGGVGARHLGELQRLHSRARVACDCAVLVCSISAFYHALSCSILYSV